MVEQLHCLFNLLGPISIIRSLQFVTHKNGDIQFGLQKSLAKLTSNIILIFRPIILSPLLPLVNLVKITCLVWPSKSFTFHRSASNSCLYLYSCVKCYRKICIFVTRVLWVLIIYILLTNRIVIVRLDNKIHGSISDTLSIQCLYISEPMCLCFVSKSLCLHVYTSTR